MKKFYKVLTIALCAAMLVAGSIAGTLAYLSMKTDTKANTFTAGDINIELGQENELNASKMVPGKTYTVDPVVTVKANSEDCWLFIKIEKTADFDEFLNYTVDDGWTLLEAGVYYREVGATATDTDFAVIKGNTVTANANRTKGEYDALSANLDLKFTAYAVQFFGFDTAADAWTEAQELDS
ncbi:MAG: SipW-dependent-type signal peptide-containing protein [Clostridia bacterium]|nr:SipW-dependent-type signal peptide-containing protein [Clostridia bacterium]